LGRDDEARPELDRALELAGELGAEPILRAVEAAGAVTDSAP
jgi:hypothetical protein